MDITRRAFLGRTSGGLGLAALTGLLQSETAANSAEGLAAGITDAPHFAGRAKRVIFLCMAGGPSHLESFDYKPKLEEMHGKPMPESYTANQPIAQLQGQKLVCQMPLIPFKRFGESGQQISEIFPHIGSVADELCIINSLHTDQINHDPAHTVMNTGTSISGRPSMGSWVTYG
ncbi:MAG: sulfatase, partial [Planctomycetaceae bacterium]|nr:sulfatase [Planctomycetaceae bacterium]